MSWQPGVPAVPAQLCGDSQVAAFVAMWRRVLHWEAADGAVPLATPCTVLAATDDALFRMTPMDVGDPFVQDAQLQRQLVRRHVLTQRVLADDPAGSPHAVNLDGERVRLARAGSSVTFVVGDDASAVPGRRVPAVCGDVLVYVVDEAFVGCDDISAAIGRHPQINPFAPNPVPELVPEPEPEPEAPQ